MDIENAKCSDAPMCVAQISTKRMYILLLTVQHKLLENTIDKKELLNFISNVQHDVKLLNDKDNSILRDLYY